MKIKKLSDNYLIRLERGEKVVEKLTQFLEQEGVTLGGIQGIGALEWVEMGYYNLQEKKYYYSTADWVEVVGMMGNIATLDGKPMIHAHIAVGDANFQVKGGHLKEAIVGATLEVIIRPIQGDVERRYNEEIGLNLWQV